MIPVARKSIARETWPAQFTDAPIRLPRLGSRASCRTSVCRSVTCSQSMAAEQELRRSEESKIAAVPVPKGRPDHNAPDGTISHSIAVQPPAWSQQPGSQEPAGGARGSLGFICAGEVHCIRTPNISSLVHRIRPTRRPHTQSAASKSVLSNRGHLGLAEPEDQLVSTRRDRGPAGCRGFAILLEERLFSLQQSVRMPRT